MNNLAFYIIFCVTKCRCFSVDGNYLDDINIHICCFIQAYGIHMHLQVCAVNQTLSMTTEAIFH